MQNKKTAFIAIVGEANVGKSTLLNSIIGRKVSIVSSKPQTTRNRVTGVYNKEEFQLVFMDTPGFLKPRNKLGNIMVKSINDTMSDVDVMVLVVNPSDRISVGCEKLINEIEKSGQPCILVINKTDISDGELVAKTIILYNERYEFQSTIPMSAIKKDGTNILIEELYKYAIDGPLYFPEDMITDQNEKSIVCELIREKMLRLLDKEIPHGIAVEIETFEESENLVSIGAIIYCEKETHKGIIIGKRGETLKKISTYARQDMEKLFGCKVFLKCHVKVKENWRDNTFLMRSFGFE